jgi:hypothetical protein
VENKGFLITMAREKLLSLTAFGLEMPFVRSQSSSESPEGHLRDQCLLIAKSNDVFHCIEHVCHLVGASRGYVPCFSNAQVHHRKEGRDCDTVARLASCNTPETLTKCHDAPVLGFLGVMELILRERDLAVTKSIRLANHSPVR